MSRPDMSRRTLLRTGAAAGAAGLTAGALGVVATNAITSTSASPATTNGNGNGNAGQVVLHVRNARTGEVEIFTGNSIIRLRDTGITSRISQAIH